MPYAMTAPPSPFGAAFTGDLLLSNGAGAVSSAAGMLTATALNCGARARAAVTPNCNCCATDGTIAGIGTKTAREGDICPVFTGVDGTAGIPGN